MWSDEGNGQAIQDGAPADGYEGSDPVSHDQAFCINLPLGDPTTCVPKLCPSDVNGDGAINVLDLIKLLLCFGLPATPPCDTGQDINQDGVVNVLDLIELLLEFGQLCPIAPWDTTWVHTVGDPAFNGEQEPPWEWPAISSMSLTGAALGAAGLVLLAVTARRCLPRREQSPD